MSAYLCDAQTIGYVAAKTGLSAVALAKLNLRAVTWRYGFTETKAVREFLGYKRVNEYLGECEVERVNPTMQGEDPQDKIEELLYQCTEGECVGTATYYQLREAAGMEPLQ